MRTGKICFEMDGEVFVVDYDADGNERGRTQISNKVVLDLLRATLEGALEKYLDNEEDNIEEETK